MLFRSDDIRDILHVGAEPAEKLVGHHRAGLGMAGTVYNIADVVQIPGDPGELRLPLGIAELEQNVLRDVRHMDDMGEAVLRVADVEHRLVGLQRVNCMWMAKIFFK